MSKDVALLILRSTGVLLAPGHGWGKVVSLSTGGGERFIQGVGALGFPMPGLFAWAAALAEFAGGLCVALGLATRVAAGFAAFTMAVAAFARHKAHLQLLVWAGLLSVSDEVRKSWGNAEPALVFLAIFVTLVLVGSGRLAVDTLLGRKR